MGKQRKVLKCFFLGIHQSLDDYGISGASSVCLSFIQCTSPRLNKLLPTQYVLHFHIAEISPCKDKSRCVWFHYRHRSCQGVSEYSHCLRYSDSGFILEIDSRSFFRFFKSMFYVLSRATDLGLRTSSARRNRFELRVVHLVNWLASKASDHNLVCC